MSPAPSSRVSAWLAPRSNGAGSASLTGGTSGVDAPLHGLDRAGSVLVGAAEGFRSVRFRGRVHTHFRRASLERHGFFVQRQYPVLRDRDMSDVPAAWASRLQQRGQIMRRIRRLPFVTAALAVTAITLFLRRRVRKNQFGKSRRIEATTSDGRRRAVPKPLTAPLGILPRGTVCGDARPEGNPAVSVRPEEERPPHAPRVAFAVWGGPPRVRPREVRSGRFGKPRGSQAPE